MLDAPRDRDGRARVSQRVPRVLDSYPPRDLADTAAPAASAQP
uniref:Uncharacterized protein n=1 Tax=Arundo donax TaxID=35708 RepID=A0A0A9BYH2_ARUDO